MSLRTSDCHGLQGYYHFYWYLEVWSIWQQRQHLQNEPSGCSFCFLLLGQVCHGFRPGASEAVAVGVQHNAVGTLSPGWTPCTYIVGCVHSLSLVLAPG